MTWPRIFIGDQLDLKMITGTIDYAAIVRKQNKKCFNSIKSGYAHKRFENRDKDNIRAKVSWLKRLNP